MGWFIDCITKNYINFKGRARRKEYWMYMLFILIASFFTIILDKSLGLDLNITTIFLLATTLPTLAVSVRRLHDTDKSGWWLLLQLVPFGNIILFIFFLMDSTPGLNRFGQYPKEL
ncbi:DUF805 domain-containing protein [Gilliamella sp. B2776]|uniref:DUF805 domain-containing protein n=1 Tax=unclassified Gilliamella TaxID=2685620 RepID=UPI002269E503|nr:MULTISPECIES: DUF805 domain-containing protein [unclassified Gilliamella]MCX8649903.1 DUF805 domain-containing protein [Gilliamella sp. B2779]MCX8653587.1 DUF805 domain-containing protein [Gilliamella sp. B2737]MCX8656223.1 DUF805 domain-containing protein [Gilliamella sp. B2894]MCX8664469.1 DUF805 domain-containing protein [Gilliamella sp. B2887]MCX8691676.1 DUF805 domain-containing protein [Gilliamella sp. B2776]